ncbi:glycosyltransferase [Paenibacillus macerans]|uniref:Glycosyltransferase n=1 Tax=Paenibacillus macerans TaxID=44252 RepID=A0A6N8F3P7_PAEMA|nr:glycosyltransferase [Paenibacillus macerans]MUG25291.1 glycosyltransferase [Paenibacillus macerans]
MKIAYLIHWNEGPDSGVYKKVTGQALAWASLGHEPALFLFTSRHGESWEEAAGGGIPVIVETYRGKPGRLARFRALLADLRAWGPDVVYHRFDLYYPSLPRLLREFPSVLEINTNDVSELALERGPGRLRYYYHRLTRRFVLGAAGGFVFVSGELAEAPCFRRYAKDKAVIGNGIDLARYALAREGGEVRPVEAQAAEVQVAEAQAVGAQAAGACNPSSREVGQAASPAEDGSEAEPMAEDTCFTDSCASSAGPHAPAAGPHSAASLAGAEDAVRFVFLGSAGQAWHGVDHIAELAAAKPHWRFDIVGVERGELALPIPPNMTFHGRLLQRGYQPLLDRADIAIGTLALYRKGMEEASPLKVREYLANGLPVITAYRETDFPDPVPFVLQLPNRPGNVLENLPAIERFARSWKGRRVEPNGIGHLDTAVKEAARVGYMERIRERKRGS